MHMASEERVVICADRRRTVLVLLAAVLFLAVGASLIAKGGVPNIVIGAISMGFGGIAALAALVAVARPTPLLTVDAAGVRLEGVIPSLRESIPWEDIAAVRIYRFQPGPVRPDTLRRVRQGEVEPAPDGAIGTLAIQWEPG
jgi:hypothetical protein